MQVQPKAFTGGGAVEQLPPRLDSGSNIEPRPQSQLWQIRPSNTDCAVLCDKSKEQELSVEGGTINISTVYSQGYVSALSICSVSMILAALFTSTANLPHAAFGSMGVKEF